MTTLEVELIEGVDGDNGDPRGNVHSDEGEVTRTTLEVTYIAEDNGDPLGRSWT